MAVETLVMAIRRKEALTEDSCSPRRPVEAQLRTIVFLSAWLVASWAVGFQLQWESLKFGCRLSLRCQAVRRLSWWWRYISGDGDDVYKNS
jgi:hypothetical protein